MRFYENVRREARVEGQSSDTTTQQALEKIKDLIGCYWGTDPIYYVSSQNKEEAGAAKLCCEILEAIQISNGEGEGWRNQ